MKKLTIIRGNEEININIKKNKYILGNNYIKKYELIRNLKMFFMNQSSEFSEETGMKVQVLENDNFVNIKRCFFYNLSTDFNLVNDLKLQAKSLVTLYLDKLLNEAEHQDTLNTINILLESLADEINLNSLIHTSFVNMTSKQFLKLIIPNLKIEELNCLEFDLTYEEIIIIQLEMIKKIIEDSLYEFSLVIIQVPMLTSKIINLLDEFQNGYFLVFSNVFHERMNIDDIAIYKSILFDLSDEVQLYDIVCDNNYKYLTITEARKYMKEYLMNEYSEYGRFINKLLK